VHSADTYTGDTSEGVTGAVVGGGEAGEPCVLHALRISKRRSARMCFNELSPLSPFLSPFWGGDRGEVRESHFLAYGDNLYLNHR
jgi:hypothetical protein